MSEGGPPFCRGCVELIEVEEIPLGDMIDSHGDIYSVMGHLPASGPRIHSEDIGPQSSDKNRAKEQSLGRSEVEGTERVGPSSACISGVGIYNAGAWHRGILVSTMEPITTGF